MGTLIAAAAGALLVVVIMWDAFEALVLPRRVTRRLRPTRMFYRVTWQVWSSVARRMRAGGRRETYLSFFGPLSLLVLLAAWAASLIAGFALLQVGLGAGLNVPGGASFTDHLYLSGETFFTLGLGDVTPVSRAGRVLVVVEAGMGSRFSRSVIGYLPGPVPVVLAARGEHHAARRAGGLTAERRGAAPRQLRAIPRS